MILARVIGPSWSTIKHPTYMGRIVFDVRPITAGGADLGPAFLAVDTVGAAPGQQVLVSREGNTARQVCEAPEQPVHSAIVGIVDAVGEK